MYNKCLYFKPDQTVPKSYAFLVSVLSMLDSYGK